MDKAEELLRQSANVFYNVSQNPALSRRESKVMKELQEAIDKIHERTRITMETKVFQWTLHRELWMWLAMNPEESKGDWPRWKINGGDVDKVFVRCFACDYAKVCNVGDDSCPLEFSDSVECLGGLWDQWNNSGDPELRSTLALAIAELPVRQGVACI